MVKYDIPASKNLLKSAFNICLRRRQKMQPHCIGDSSQSCFHGCCVDPCPGLPDHNYSSHASASITSAANSRHNFEVAMASSIHPNSEFTNHESLPSLHDSLSNFIKIFPEFTQTDQADRIREQEYYHLPRNNHVCLDYVGHGLFSYSQQQSHHHHQAASIASTSSSSAALEPPPFFNISYNSVNLNSHMQFDREETKFEHLIKKRVMAFMNISEDDYTLVFTANQTSAFKLLADNYPFQKNRNLLTVYDCESEAVNVMIDSSRKQGARVMSAEFLWPNLGIHTRNLKKKVVSKNKRKRGLFVFPLQSRMTGTRYSYLWMSLAQENGWHVLLDASAIGAKEMETLGLSLFQPDFLICSFFKVFGENPSGFGCLFVKKSSVSVLSDSNTATNTGIVRLVPATKLSDISEEMDPVYVKNEISNVVTSEQHGIEDMNIKQKGTEIEEIETKHVAESEDSELEFKGLDNADSLGLVLISARARYLINWLLTALMSLEHPHSETGLKPVRIYGPKVKFNRGPAVAFNVFDWKGEKISPVLVQKLADRNNISLSYGFLNHILFKDKYEEERERKLETTSDQDQDDKVRSGIFVVTAAIGFLTNFEDTYRLWAFISRFLDADFVEKERWRYTALNQKMIEV